MVILFHLLQMKEGDYVDLILGTEDKQWNIQRVRLVKVSSTKSRKDKYVVNLRAWRSHNVFIPKPQKFIQSRKNEWCRLAT